MKMAELPFESVAGGQFDSLEPSRIPAGGWARALNYLPAKDGMRRRAGSAPFALTTPPIEGVTACIPVSGLLGSAAGFEEWALLAVTLTGECALIKGSGAWGEKLTRVPGAALVSDEMPWQLRQRGGIVYGARRNAGGLMRIEGNRWLMAGRPAPASGATASWVGGGSLAAAAHRVWYTYYDEATTYEGNPTEVSIAGTTGGTIRLVNLQPPDASVAATHYRIYVSTAGGAVGYPVALVAKGETTCDITGYSSSSTTLSTRNGLPSSEAIGFEIWNERGWLLTKKKCYYSDFGKLEGYSELQTLSFQPDDGDEFTTVYGWRNAIVLAKRRGVVLLTGIDRRSFEQTLWTEMVGCIAPHSMRDCEGTLIWLSEDGFCAAELGAPPSLISSNTVRAALSQMDPLKSEQVVAETIPDLHIYFAVFPRKDGTWGGIAYNWQTRAWSEIEFPARSRYVHTGFDATGAVRIFAINDTTDQPYVLFEGLTDNGSPIRCELRSAAPNLGRSRLAAVRAVELLAAPTRWPITLSLYREGETTPSYSREIRPDGGRGWRRYPLPLLLCSEAQIGITYQGADEWWVSGMEWDVVRTDYERGRR